MSLEQELRSKLRGVRAPAELWDRIEGRSIVEGSVRPSLRLGSKWVPVASAVAMAVLLIAAAPRRPIEESPSQASTGCRVKEPDFKPTVSRRSGDFVLVGGHSSHSNSTVFWDASGTCVLCHAVATQPVG